MMAIDIPRHRLQNQRIANSTFARPSQAVAWFGAMQAQARAAVKWAIGLRCQAASDAVIEQAFTEKSIIRTWLLRGTLQVAAAADIRWMLNLLAPRLIAQSAGRHRQLELDDDLLARSAEIITSALQDNKQMTRAALLLALEQAGISPEGQRGYHILHHAALKALICFGPMQGKEQTFVLLDEWVPQGPHLENDEVLAELASRYFRSHGPATLPDFVWWSGLTKTKARAGLEMNKSWLHRETIAGETYWWPPDDALPDEVTPTVYLLPAFDEYYLGYTKRDALLDAGYDKQVVSSNGIFRPMIVVDGQIVGIWQQTVKQGSLVVRSNLFRTLTASEKQALRTAVDQVGAFLGLTPLF